MMSKLLACALAGIMAKTIKDSMKWVLELENCRMVENGVSSVVTSC